MRTHTFDLSFQWDPSDALSPLDASARIVLKSDITSYSREGKIAITTQCANVGELEAWVSLLKDELDRVLAAGRKKFVERDNLARSA